MPISFQKQIDKLNNAEDGITAHAALKRLWPYKKPFDGLDEKTRAVLIQYMTSGKIGHFRTHVAARLSDYATPASKDITESFLAGLKDKDLRYWSIKGVANILGKQSYSEICAVALNESYDLEERSHAIQVLARLSRQPFFRGLPEDLGDWKAEDLRIREVIAWREAGFPDGQGMRPPQTDPALTAPSTSIEIAAATFESKLRDFRNAREDSSINPANYLCPCAPGALDKIEKQWKLPKNYLDFLARFSPFNITAYLYVPKIRQDFRFYTAEELIERQTIFTHVSGEPVSEWPQHYVAIGDAWLNAVVFDLSRSNGEDAPLLWTDHDEFPLMFKPCAKSFASFLERIKVTDKWWG